MDIFGITDGKKCENICKYAPPENKWPCVDCDIRCHDRAELKEEVVNDDLKQYRGTNLFPENPIKKRGATPQ